MPRSNRYRAIIEANLPIDASFQIGIAKLVIVLGRDSTGLTNEGLQKCDFVVTIPTSKDYPTLNLAQAAGILLYELAKDKEETVSSISFFVTKCQELRPKSKFSGFRGDKYIALLGLRFQNQGDFCGLRNKCYSFLVVN